MYLSNLGATLQTRFRRTLERGLLILDVESRELKDGDKLSGETAFTLNTKCWEAGIETFGEREFRSLPSPEENREALRMLRAFGYL